MNCKTQSLNRLLWLLPLRAALEVLACFNYALQRQWGSAIAPIAGLLWCLSHPRNIYRRRRHSQRLRRTAALDGIYRGSLLYQYYARGVRRSLDLIAEGAMP